MEDVEHSGGGGGGMGPIGGSWWGRERRGGRCGGGGVHEGVVKFCRKLQKVEKKIYEKILDYIENKKGF